MNRCDHVQRDLVVSRELGPRTRRRRTGRSGFDLHVAGVSRLKIFLVHSRAAASRLREIAKELLVERRDGLAARLSRSAGVVARLCRTVVIKEIFRWQEAERAQERGVEKGRAIYLFEQRGLATQAEKLG